MPRIHVVSLPHTLLTRAYDWCAYTAKVRRFVDMLGMAEHQALVYGPDVHDEMPKIEEYITIATEADRRDWFGTPEWLDTRVFDRWQSDDPCWTMTNTRAALAIRERWKAGDVLGIIGGLCQQQIVDQLLDLDPIVVEWGIGYSGVLENSNKVFESYAWMHHVAGLRRRDDIAYFDDVIPNCFDPDDFTYRSRPGKYLLYMGRPNPRKGLPIITEMAKRTDVPVIIAGQPGAEIPGTTYAGLVTGKTKATLLSEALAVLTPTTYLEPFGGVAVEAMMSGTPVIATDWGAFTETVIPGITGYRCRMLEEFLDAIRLCAALDRSQIRMHALARYSTTVGASMYDRYLNRLATLRAEGWYTLPVNARYTDPLLPR